MSKPKICFVCLQSGSCKPPRLVSGSGKYSICQYADTRSLSKLATTHQSLSPCDILPRPVGASYASRAEGIGGPTIGLRLRFSVTWTCSIRTGYPGSVQPSWLPRSHPHRPFILSNLGLHTRCYKGIMARKNIRGVLGVGLYTTFLYHHLLKSAPLPSLLSESTYRRRSGTGRVRVLALLKPATSHGMLLGNSDHQRKTDSKLRPLPLLRGTILHTHQNTILRTHTHRKEKCHPDATYT